MWQPTDETSTLEGVQHRSHAAGRDDEAIGDDGRFEGLTCAFEYGECLLGGAGQLVVVPRLAVVQADQPVAGADDVRVTLGREPVRVRVFALEVRSDDDERLGCARRGGTAAAVPPLRFGAVRGQESVSS
jgi:hypothetical protein